MWPVSGYEHSGFVAPRMDSETTASHEPQSQHSKTYAGSVLSSKVGLLNLGELSFIEQTTSHIAIFGRSTGWKSVRSSDGK